MTEGDIIAIFSQFGEPVYVNLMRDKETGKSKGFAFLKYEDQRSTDLAVDNLGGATVLGRILKVDHTRYKRRDDEEEQGGNGAGAAGDLTMQEGDGDQGRSNEEESRPLLKEEKELAELIRNHDEDDPMKDYLIREKKEEVTIALAQIGNGKKQSKVERKHHHRHRSEREKGGRHKDDSQHGHRSREDNDDGGRHERHRHRHGR